MIRMPATSETIMNNTSLPMVTAASPASTEPLVATPDSKAIMPIASTSSTIRMPKISCANFSRFMPSSLSALTMMVVDDTDSMAPRNTASICFQPK